jgi:hypothetical protein
MTMSVISLLSLLLIWGTQNLAASGSTPWRAVAAADVVRLSDDDIARHPGPGYLNGIDVSELVFSENGFDWHLIRFVMNDDRAGPLWIVPHDDENAAFEAAISALRHYGGVAIMVNSGPGSARMQVGNGICGVRPERATSCDPNRNFAPNAPQFTAAFLDQRPAGQPIIALHTNSPGFSGDGEGGRGEITILDKQAFARGEKKPRADGHFAVNPTAEMANYDTLGLVAYLASDGTPGEAAIRCRKAMTAAGTHFWHERILRSDGSMSNYLALHQPGIAYFNAESRAEVDLALAASRHKIMIDAYLNGCNASDSGNKQR